MKIHENFCGTQVEVIGVSGAHGSGKTLFLLSINPAKTLYFDFEKSGGMYCDALHIPRVDMPDLLLERYPKGHRPAEAFAFWLEKVRELCPAGKYSVICVDTVGDIETGLPDYVASKHLDYGCGFKSPESFRATGGIYWSEVKNFWKQVLAELSSRCETFAFASHLKAKYRKGEATGEMVPAGKSTLLELATLYLVLDRDPEKGVPSASVLKSRLSTVAMVDGEIHAISLLPPRLPIATYAEICHYIRDGGVKRLKKDERPVPPKQMSVDERLLLERDIAEARLETAKVLAPSVAKPVLAAVTGLRLKGGIDAKRPVEASQTDDTLVVVPDVEVVKTSPPVAGFAAAVAEPELTPLQKEQAPCGEIEMAQIAECVTELGWDQAQYEASLSPYKVRSARQLCVAEARNYIHDIRKIRDEWALQKWTQEALTR